MLVIRKLSEIGFVAQYHGKEICKINRTQTGDWVVRGGPLNGEKFNSDLAAFSDLKKHYDGYYRVDTSQVNPRRR